MWTFSLNWSIIYQFQCRIVECWCDLGESWGCRAEARSPRSLRSGGGTCSCRDKGLGRALSPFRQSGGSLGGSQRPRTSGRVEWLKFKLATPSWSGWVNISSLKLQRYGAFWQIFIFSLCCHSFRPRLIWLLLRSRNWAASSWHWTWWTLFPQMDRELPLLSERCCTVLVKQLRVDWLL